MLLTYVRLTQLPRLCCGVWGVFILDVFAWCTRPVGFAALSTVGTEPERGSIWTLLRSGAG